LPKITKQVVDALRPDLAGKDVFAWDSELRGFGVRVKPSGAAYFLIQYRNDQGKTRRLVIGRVGAVTPDEARAKARRLLVQTDDGRDPSAERHDAREALTVAELCAQYLDAADAGLVLTRFGRPKRPSTIINDKSRIARHVLPLIGRLPAQSLTRQVVQRMSDDIAQGKTSTTIKTGRRGKAVVEGGAPCAARVVELLGGIWTWVERRGLISGQSPIRGVEKRKGDRFLSPAELARLGETLRAAEADRPMAAAALRLLAVTGLRREEAVGLRWSEIDAASSCLRLEATKTGRAARPIGKAALDVIAALPLLDETYCFPKQSGAGSADLKKAIGLIFDAAGLRDVRSHDLRRTFASVAADEGYSDATIAELLGHARRGVTARHYIRRPDAALVAAADKVAARIAAAMDGRHAEIIDIKGRA
jgi:integrase